MWQAFPHISTFTSCFKPLPSLWGPVRLQGLNTGEDACERVSLCPRLESFFFFFLSRNSVRRHKSHHPSPETGETTEMWSFVCDTRVCVGDAGRAGCGRAQCAEGAARWQRAAVCRRAIGRGSDPPAGVWLRRHVVRPPACCRPLCFALTAVCWGSSSVSFRLLFSCCLFHREHKCSPSLGLYFQALQALELCAGGGWVVMLRSQSIKFVSQLSTADAR